MKCERALHDRDCLKAHTAKCSGPVFGKIPSVLFDPAWHIRMFERMVPFNEHMDRAGAETFLAGLPEGFYVVRRASVAQALSLSVVGRDRAVYHMLISKNENDVWTEPASVGVQGSSFGDLLRKLPYLVLTDLDLSFMLKPIYRPAMTKEAAEDRLLSEPDGVGKMLLRVRSCSSYSGDLVLAGIVRRSTAPGGLFVVSYKTRRTIKHVAVSIFGTSRFMLEPQMDDPDPQPQLFATMEALMAHFGVATTLGMAAHEQATPPPPPVPGRALLPRSPRSVASNTTPRLNHDDDDDDDDDDERRAPGPRFDRLATSTSSSSSLSTNPATSVAQQHRSAVNLPTIIATPIDTSTTTPTPTTSATTNMKILTPSELPTIIVVAPNDVRYSSTTATTSQTGVDRL
jgi:hypothetical protein